MKFISRKFHAVLDYMTGIALIAAPWLFNFADVEAAKWIAVIAGAGLLVMSFFTDYEGGGKKIIPMSVHLTVDIIMGIFLAASPWLFGFADMVYLPHLIVGILEIGGGMFTHRQSEHPYSHGSLRHAH